MNLDDYRIDPARLAGIVWDFATKAPTPDGKPHPEHICFRIVPKGPSYQSALAAALEAHSADLRRGRVAQEVMERIVGEVHAQVTLVDWWNLEIGGQPVPYSRAVATELLTDPRWLLVRRFVDSAFANESALLAEAEEAAAGN